MGTKAERQYAMTQALANTRIEGHKPTPEFLADAAAVVEGKLTYDQAVKASAARATGRTHTREDTPPLAAARPKVATARGR